MPYATVNLDHLDWTAIASQLDAEGYALLPGFLSESAARDVARQAEGKGVARRASLASMGLGRGELLYPGDVLSIPVELWRAAFYPRLATIANRWNEILGVTDRYPKTLVEFLRRNQKAGQVRAQSHVNRLGVDDHVSLHQCSDGEQVFPLQIVGLLSQPGADFEGGEFVMTEQRPRMQSRPMVLPLKLGDMAIIATAERPFKGTKGHYRVNLKHAISRVHKGERIGLELSFHDAL
ncbi:oxygenase, catalysing oxidative methylation of damaged DNA family protein [Burkholderia pseudomallei TSV 25]|uniref:2OG-Fe(II) oxygenase n=1 Tax=Burkholderia pseudomallei TaxID=28450 RepID=UPI00050FF5FF|nr:2OG-Fe(II) oxygenase [Burkholderia pseudomallei]AIV46734.1 oxygenase, catalysing oxidative methylation of damaged DNA family protein [Burkholderia pseudomallei TSV 48]KGC35482.1 oxygenase, catalysing oxidative methylation of damaged DNA family protein [Burkholderia pseudomallei]KGW10544.1 oxygenase, catalysing oxidative methylation of damaged DNA family protein [Burkholderia pseudomallei TSV 25]KIX58641.1 prolyl 4-hydroxylase [Burkholderia pseudomallei]